jgi:hypothetical protein
MISTETITGQPLATQYYRHQHCFGVSEEQTEEESI